MNFREKIGLRQSFDDWAKGINNTLNNLYNQGLSGYAYYNLETLKKQGFQTRIDNKGREVLSRGNENKELYKSKQEAETKDIKDDLINVKEAKKRERGKEKPPKPPRPPEPPTPPTPPDDDELIDMAGTWYELAKVIAEIMSRITGEAVSIKEAIEFNSEITGKRAELDRYKAYAKAKIKEAKEYYKELAQYDNILS